MTVLAQQPGHPGPAVPGPGLYPGFHCKLPPSHRLQTLGLVSRLPAFGLWRQQGCGILALRRPPMWCLWQGRRKNPTVPAGTSLEFLIPFLREQEGCAGQGTCGQGGRENDLSPSLLPAGCVALGSSLPMSGQFSISPLSPAVP